MVKSGYTSVSKVDTHTTWPPGQPGGRRGVRAAQTLLFLLLSMALFGLAIEAYFIYRLYQSESATSEMLFDSLPSKAVAHLTDGQDVVHGNKVMAWSMEQEPTLQEMDYKEGSLVVEKEGYYYVYSKVSFVDTGLFHHSVNLHTKRYAGKSIPLLTSRKYSKGFKKTRSNSYLGGVFHLNKDDALFVEVSNTSKILRKRSSENIFGAYMI